MNRKTAFIIAHWSSSGLVADHLFEFTKFASKISNHVIFASTNINIDEEKRISKICSVLKVDNIGYDFWSYKKGFEMIQNILPNIDRLIFMNSSILIFDPKFLMNKLDHLGDEQGIKSITISNDRAMHAQSFFVAFDGNQLVNSKDMKEWWDIVKPTSSKQDVIDKYELGMSDHFRRKGVKFTSIYTPTSLQKLIAIARAIGNYNLPVKINEVTTKVEIDLELDNLLNPTHFHWDSIADETGTIKIELLKFNKTKQNIAVFIDELKATKPYFSHLLQNSLTV